MTADPSKDLTARICTLCEQLFPNEWVGKYTGPREDFRDWMNTKTSLNVDHTVDKVGALTAWKNALEVLASQ
jgi:hypothetical protein